MDACLTPALLESSAPVSLMVPGSVENALLATVAMESSVKTLMRYAEDPLWFDALPDYGYGDSVAPSLLKTVQRGS